MSKHSTLLSTIIVLAIITINNIINNDSNKNYYYSISDIQFSNEIPIYIQQRLLTTFQLQNLKTNIPLIIQIGNINNKQNNDLGTEGYQISYQKINNASLFIDTCQPSKKQQVMLTIKQLNQQSNKNPSKFEGIIYQIIGNPFHLQNNNKTTEITNIGLMYGIYTFLEEILGFSFRHPFLPIIPQNLTNNTVINLQLKNIIVKQPELRLRIHHYHSMHPLELTEVLNGFGEYFSITNQYSFDEMLENEVTMFFDYLIANKQNHFRWVLLESNDYKEFTLSKERQERLKKINDKCHLFGLFCGVSISYVMIQQNSFRLVSNVKASLIEQKLELQKRLDFLKHTNLDFISTSSGFTEFTHGSPDLMLFYMNETCNYMYQHYEMKSDFLNDVEAHISQGQIIENMTDPVTGKLGLNFNYLPYYADPRILLSIHTVQFYSLIDPTAQSYGNSNFTSMFDFLITILKKQPNRKVVFYPEAAYWVNFDINVPLFLPMYAERRLFDLLLIQQRIKKENITKQIMDGHTIFSSGQQFGYWFHESIILRNTWNPSILLQNTHEQNVKNSFDNVLSHLFLNVKDQFLNILVDLTIKQRNWLIYGNLNQTCKSDCFMTNGMAYLNGWDASADVMALVAKIRPAIQTQPPKLTFLEAYLNFGQPKYESQIKPILNGMMYDFCQSAEQLQHLTIDNLNNNAKILIDDIIESSTLLCYRATLIYQLYEYVYHSKPLFGLIYSKNSNNNNQINNEKEKARETIEKAHSIILQKLNKFGIDKDRITAWRENPTVYDFTYLWHAKTLYYWWRDYLKATNLFSLNVESPCFMNIDSFLKVVNGDGVMEKILEMLREYFGKDEAWIADCLAAPEREPPVPPFL
ncbi:hypothetical protein ABK040_010952 [Willaertia magna]